VEHRHRITLERLREHLARADSELEVAQHFVDPETRDEDEMAFVRAIANARTLVGDAWRPRDGGLRGRIMSRLFGGSISHGRVRRTGTGSHGRLPGFDGRTALRPNQHAKGGHGAVCG